MAKNSGLNIIRFNCLLFFLLFSFIACSQEIQLVDSVQITEPDLVSMDRNGNIYISDIKGNIYQYSFDLKAKLVFSPDRPARITILDAWQGLRIFCFYRDIQEYKILDRFLVSGTNYSFNSPGINFISTATITFDNKLWLIDQPSMSLIKYDIRSREIEFIKPLELTLTTPFSHVLLFREYQNKIYLLDEKAGLFIFDNFGNFNLHREIQFSGNPGFFEDYLYYQYDDSLIFENMYSNNTFSLKLPLNRKPDRILRSVRGLYLIENNYLFLYSIK